MNRWVLARADEWILERVDGGFVLGNVFNHGKLGKSLSCESKRVIRDEKIGKFLL